jgi:hypothetical protein
MPSPIDKNLFSLKNVLSKLKDNDPAKAEVETEKPKKAGYSIKMSVDSNINSTLDQGSKISTKIIKPLESRDDSFTQDLVIDNTVVTPLKPQEVKIDQPSIVLPKIKTNFNSTPEVKEGVKAESKSVLDFFQKRETPEILPLEAENKTISLSIQNNKNEISLDLEPKETTTFSEKVSESFTKIKENVASYRDKKNTDQDEDEKEPNQEKKMVIISSNPAYQLNTEVKEPAIGIIAKGVNILFDPLHIVSYLIGISACVLFIYTALSEKISFLKIPVLRLERVTLISFAIMIVLDVILVFFITRKPLKGIYTFLALSTLQIACFLFAFRLSGASITSINTFTLTTNYIVFLLPLIIFMQCLGIIQNKNRLWVNILQSMVIFAQLFGTLKLLNEFSYNPELLANSIYKIVRIIPPYVWTTFSALAVAVLTSYGLKKKFVYFFFTFLVMVPLLNILMLTKSDTYWYQTILALIVWDLMYIPILEADRENTDERVLPKLLVSGVYHIILFLTVLIINGYLNIIR